jgi:hypothetical protein
VAKKRGIKNMFKRKYNKYKVAPKSKRTYKGIIFQSKLEMERYIVLKIQERAGKITDLKRQPSFIIHKGKKYTIKYNADFEYIQEEKRIIEDAKGTRTDIFKLKKKLFEDNCRAKEIRKGNKKLITWEVE